MDLPGPATQVSRPSPLPIMIVGQNKHQQASRRTEDFSQTRRDALRE
jgi:hypothetical protein